MSETLTLQVLLILVVVTTLVQQWFHRRDLREAMDGIASFYKGAYDEHWKQSQFELKELRGELKEANDKLLRVKIRAAPTPPSSSHGSPGAASAPRTSPEQNGRPRRKDIDFATMGGV